MKTNKIVGIIAVVALVVGVIALFKPSTPSAPVAPVRPLGGNIVTNTETHVNGLNVIGTGTTTLKVKSLTTGKPGCIEMNMASSSVVRLQFTASTTASGADGYVTFKYGTCQ